MENVKGIDLIASALSKAQAEFVQPEKNKTVTVRPKNSPPYSFEYADYSAIVEAVRGPLSKNGIAFTHALERAGEALVLITRLIHESGQELSSIWPMTNSTDPKEVGGDMTYGKRYCLSAITGCVADDDADAEPENVTSFQTRSAPKTPQFTETDLPDPVRTTTAPRPTGTNPIKIGQQPLPIPEPELSEPQITRLWTLTGKMGYSNDEVHDLMLRKWKYTSAKQLTRLQYAELIDFTQKNPKGQD